MSAARDSDWVEANRRHLQAELDALRRRLDPDSTAPPPEIPVTGTPPYRLDLLCERFGLSAFERLLLVLAAGVELDGQIARLAHAADPAGRGATFALALARFPDAHWSALAPDAPLRRWQFIELRDEGSLVHARLGLDEHLLHWLTGAAALSTPIGMLANPLVPDAALVPPHAALADRLAERWRKGGTLPVLELVGGDAASRLKVAAATADRLGMAPWRLPVAAIPADPIGERRFVRQWERELVLSNVVPVIDPGDSGNGRAAAFAEAFQGPVFLAGPTAGHDWVRAVVRHELTPFDYGDRRKLWAQELSVDEHRAGLDRLAYQFTFGPTEIARVAAETKAEASDVDLVARAWAHARRQSRRDASGFVRRVTADVTWDDLVLPEAQRRTLAAVAEQVRHQATVYAEWGFGAKSSRGLGITALFSGPSGAGKTTAAEALAASLSLDLLHVDLSQVVSKYIGETEKNLEQVFAAAEASGAILLFDEADAIFGKRSEVRDSHDRYANMEVSFLLQRMEAYRGLAILTTNQKSVIDDAFLRRIRFVIHFPFPDRAMRAELWRRALPPQVRAEEPDWAALSRFALAGGSIRNIALNAAFLAAAAGDKVRCAHVDRATSTEAAKMETPQVITQIARANR